jgi:hypothetical protein
MINAERIDELRSEIGHKDLAEILDVFLGEAEGLIETFPTDPPPEEVSRLLHFLRSGAVNLGLSGIAGVAVGPRPDGTAPGATDLRLVLEATRSKLASFDMAM